MTRASSRAFCLDDRGRGFGERPRGLPEATVRYGPAQVAVTSCKREPALRPCGQLNPPISQREHLRPGVLGTDPKCPGEWPWVLFVVCRRRARGCRAASLPLTSVPSWNVSQRDPNQVLEGGEGAERAKSPGLGWHFSPPGWRTKLLRENACCPKAGRKSMSIVHPSRKVRRGKKCVRVQCLRPKC